MNATLYTSPHCLACDLVAGHLASIGVATTKRSTDENGGSAVWPDAVMAQLSRQGGALPVVEVGNLFVHPREVLAWSAADLAALNRTARA